MSQSTPMPMCPMAGFCKGIAQKPGAGLVLLVPGVVLVALGIVILVEPRVLVWLVALALIFMGIALVLLGRMIRSLVSQPPIQQ